MNRCPLELWTKIATFACTNGGYTGYSLSLVSHTMYSIAEYARYYTVSLSSTQRLFAFAAQIVALNKPPVIYHLLVTGARADHKPRMFKMAREERAKIREAMHTILSSAASHLRTLVIHNWSSHDPVPGDVCFPFFEDATLTDTLWGELAAGMHSRFPMLRRLHISSTGRVYLHGLWDILAESTPLLTHLRLTNVASETELPCFLRILLDIVPQHQVDPTTGIITDNALSFNLDPEEVQEALATASRLSALGYICVQPATAGCIGYSCRNAFMTKTHVHQEMMLNLEDIARAAGGGKSVGKFILLPKHKQYSAEEARRDWLETIEGRDGAWPGSSGGLVGCVPSSMRAKWPEKGNTFASQSVHESVTLPA